MVDSSWRVRDQWAVALRKVLKTGALCVLACAGSGAWAADAPAAGGDTGRVPLLRPMGLPLDVVPPFASESEGENISGAGCAVIRGNSARCLLMSDEGRAARLFTITEDIFSPGNAIALLPEEENGTKLMEIDGEGVAYDSGFYYVVGSHSLSRGESKFEKSRYFLFRLPVDPVSGFLPFPHNPTVPDPAIQRSERLADILKTVPILKDHINKPLTENAMEIEGIAVRDGFLYLGFRGPVLDGKAFVVKMPLDVAFGTAPITAEAFRLPLGDGMGVRDLASVKGGFLVMSGPQAGRRAAAQIFFWDGANRVEALGELSGNWLGKGKPEGLVLLKDEYQAYNVLVLLDSMPNGEPTRYRIPKPSEAAH